MNTTPFDMRSMLVQAGFAIRGATRANCIHCGGSSRATVSYTTDVAYCHRCKWTANIAKLARELRLLDQDSKAAADFREQAQRRARLEVEIRPFEDWRETKIRQISDKYRLLVIKTAHAGEVVAKFPACESAWDALARFYHAEAKLSAAFDYLTFAKSSDWLEDDSTPVELFEVWKSNAA